MEEDINKLRKEIDKLDTKLISLLRERLIVAKKIGKYKKKRFLPVRDMKREKELLLKVSNKAKEQGIKDIENIKKMFKSIISYSRKVQEED